MQFRTQGTLALTALALAIGAHCAEVSAARVGQAAPEFELPGAGGAVRLSALRGKVVYV